MVDAALARPGGRTARVRSAVLDATVAELIEHGYGGLTVDGVAARAGVNKTTLYRRWGGRDSLIVDAVETFAAAQAKVPDSGDIDEDLRLWARSILATLTGPVSGALVRAVFGGAGDSPQVRDLRHRFWLTRSTLVTPIVQRAVERGQLPAGTVPEEVIKHVGAPLYYRLLVLAEPLTPAAADLAAAVTAAAAHAGVFVPPARACVAGRTTVEDPGGLCGEC
jgi:AcrR family transcriptional regulator